MTDELIKHGKLVKDFEQAIQKVVSDIKMYLMHIIYI